MPAAPAHNVALWDKARSWLSSNRPWVIGRRYARRALEEARRGDTLVYRTFTGPRAGGDAPLALHYLGRGRFAQDFLVFFSRAPGDANIQQEVRSQLRWPQFLRQRQALSRAPHDADLMVIDRVVGLFAGKHTPAYVPFVEAHLPVAPSMEAQLAQVRSKGHRRKLQAAIKRGFQWRKSRSPADFALFYDTMYAPFVEQRFQFDRSVISRDDMQRVFARRGFLLLLEVDGTAVSGAMMYVDAGDPTTLAYWKYGLADAASLTANVFGERNGLTEAMVLAYAVEQGFARIDFGLTRALPADGIFTHKKRLGCDFAVPADLPASFALHVPRRRRAMVCAAQPMVVVEHDALVVWMGHQGPLDAAAAARLGDRLRGGCFPAAKALHLFVADCPDGDRARLEAAAKAVSDEGSVRVATHFSS